MDKKVLIVDDELHLRMLLEQTLEPLEDEDVDLFSASDGQEALDIITQEKPQLVFLDVMMPKMNGFDVCQQVKKILQLDVYIIMLTAKGQEFDKKKGEEVGADVYMTKPFDPDEVLEKAMDVLGIEDND